MVIYKNGTIISNSAFPDTDFCGDADFVIPDDSDLAKKIFGIKSNVKLLFDDDRLVDAVEMEPTVRDPAPTDHERLEALEAAFTGFASEVISLLENMGNLGAPLSPKLKNMFAQIKNNNLEENR